MINGMRLLSKRSELTPERVALVELATGRRYTYAALNERANRIANFLRDQMGVGRGDRVAILAHNDVAFVDLLYGLMKIGAILTPLNWRLAPGELDYIIGNADPHVLVVGPEFRDTLARLSYPVDHLLSLDGGQMPEAIPYEEALTAGSPAEPAGPDLSGEEPACIMYTSGTTGRPKGALLPQRQIVWNAINTVISWELGPGDVSPVFTPMFHAGGLFVFLAPLFYAGGRVVIARQFDLEASLRALEEEQCTVALGVPTIYQMWLESPVLDGVDLSGMRWFISGGAPCPPSLVRAWHRRTGIVLRQGYGLTEVGTNCFTMTDREALSRAGSVGRPIFHSEARLVDSEGRPVPAGGTGELIFSGPHVSAGYWRNPEATDQALREMDGRRWFFTGDMARRDDEGYFYIAGRFKDMIISGGENVYAAEVEAVFTEHPAVAEAALIGRPDEKWGEVGVMIVVLEKGQRADGDGLRDFCRERLAAYKVPKEVVFAEALPYSPYGKVIKRELKSRYVKGETA